MNSSRSQWLARGTRLWLPRKFQASGESRKTSGPQGHEGKKNEGLGTWRNLNIRRERAMGSWDRRGLEARVPGSGEVGCQLLDTSYSPKHPPWSCSPLVEVSRQVVNPRYSSSREGWLLIVCGHLEPGVIEMTGASAPKEQGKVSLTGLLWPMNYI